VDEGTWLHHPARGDYSRWTADAIKDDVLAKCHRNLSYGAMSPHRRPVMSNLDSLNPLIRRDPHLQFRWDPPLEIVQHLRDDLAQVGGMAAEYSRAVRFRAQLIAGRPRSCRRGGIARTIRQDPTTHLDLMFPRRL
jgi:hypothetical protein